jgi:hypothetical protein
MASLELTPEELLSGANVTFDVPIPNSILRPGQSNLTSEEEPVIVTLCPLTIGTFQLIMKAAKNDPGLIPLLMIKEALIKPKLSLEQVKAMHLGLVNFLIAEIREISGLNKKKTPPI